MEESGMNKLIKLLNEYDDGMVSWYEEYFSTEGLFVTNAGQCFREEFILSKRYGFIKWLVDNDKIDFDNRDLKDEFMLEFERYPVFQGNTYDRDFNENGMIMLLSIQEDPISFLISILK